MLTTEEIYAKGYAIPLYDISTTCRRWRFREEEHELPLDAVPLFELPGVDFQVARIEDVRRG